MGMWAEVVESRDVTGTREFVGAEVECWKRKRTRPWDCPSITVSNLHNVMLTYSRFWLGAKQLNRNQCLGSRTQSSITE